MPHAVMATSPTPAAGGVLIAAGAIAGAAIGLSMDQPTAGFLIGTAIGVALSLLVWWRGRR